MGPVSSDRDYRQDPIPIIAGCLFPIKSNATEKLYQVVQEMLNPRPTDTIVDTYAGCRDHWAQLGCTSSNRH